MPKEKKEFTLAAKRGIRGEAFFESLITEYCIPHHIVGPKDIGIDFICEWVFGENPTGVLFAAQVKTFSLSVKKHKVEKIEDRSRLNNLPEFKITNSNLRINNKTLQYWQSLGIPFYLFIAVIDPDETKMNLYYKRFSEYLTKFKVEAALESDFIKSEYYKVNVGSKFSAFADENNKTGGFARDLFIDYIRWNYYKGSIAYLNPKSIGLEGFPGDNNFNIFPELFDEYKVKIFSIYDKLNNFIKNHHPEKWSEVYNTFNDESLPYASQASDSDKAVPSCAIDDNV